MVFQLASGGDIMIINADGTGLRKLTTGLDPALSYDGKTVAFTRWQGDQGSVWLINTDGSNERQIAFGLTKAKGAEWSPDGKQVVVNYSHEGRPGPTNQCSSGTHAPSGAYDVHTEIKNGKTFVCYTLPPDEHWTLHAINLADGKAEDLYGGMYSFRPTWDPTKSWRIVSQAGNGLLETSVNKDHYQYLTDQPHDEAPSISPDGRFLAITSNGDGSRYDIFRLNSDGSGRTRLTDMPLWTTAGPDAQNRLAEPGTGLVTRWDSNRLPDQSHGPLGGLDYGRRRFEPAPHVPAGRKQPAQLRAGFCGREDLELAVRSRQTDQALPPKIPGP